MTLHLIALITGYTVLCAMALALIALAALMAAHAVTSLVMAIRLKRRPKWRNAGVLYLFAFCYTQPGWAEHMLDRKVSK